MSDWRIPLSDLDYGPEEEAAVLRVLRSKWLSMGPEVQVFEREFATAIGARHALAVANGTAALHLAYLALGVGPGDEVIQPAINFVAAANMTFTVGAKPAFVDVVGLEEPTIDPGSVERAVTPRTRALVVMHHGGYPCRMGELAAICRERGIALIEDACHAIGARYLNPALPEVDGRMLGAVGAVGCFSFFSNKNLATGEGGMVVTDRDDLAEKLRLLRSHGMTSLTWDRHRGHASTYDVLLNGYNYRLDELHAALGRCQLAKLAKNNLRRGRLVALYRERLGSLAGWVIPFTGHGGESSWHLMTVVAPDEASRRRVAEALLAERIQTSLHYPCVADFSAMRNPPVTELERSRAFARRAITLPLYPTMTEQQVNDVAAVIRRASSHNQVAGK